MGLNQQKLLSDYIKKSRFWEANSDVQIRYLQTVTLKKKIHLQSVVKSANYIVEEMAIRI